MTGEEAEAAAEDALAFIRALVGAWDCCGTCAGGVLLRHDSAVATRALADTAAIAAGSDATAARTRRTGGT